MKELRVGGVTWSSFSDWRGEVCSLMFLAGCNLRCRYCHNPSFVLFDSDEHKDIKTNNLIKCLNDRSIEHICISGGEPFFQWDALRPVLRSLRYADIKVKIDTNGTFPNELASCIEAELVDSVAIDIKATLNNNEYRKITQKQVNTDKIRSSIKYVDKADRVELQTRTTVFSQYMDSAYLMRIYKDLCDVHTGSFTHTFQAFRCGDCLDETFNTYESLSNEDLRSMTKGIVTRGELYIV